MDQKELLTAAAADLRSTLPLLLQFDARMGERGEAALRHLTGEHIDAAAAREAVQAVENSLLQAGSQSSEYDRLLQQVRAVDQKLTAALSAGHYAEG